MLPWSAMLRAALAAGIGPEAFWRLSLKEWRWLSAREAMSGGRLAEMMGAFPDGAEGGGPAASSFDVAQDEPGRAAG